MWHKSSDGQPISITWGPEAANMTDAERQEIVDKLVADSKKQHEEHCRAVSALEGLPYVAVPVEQLADIYERFKRLTRLGQTSIEEFGAIPTEIAKLRREIFLQADFGALYAGQWLPRETVDKVCEKLKAESAKPEDAALA